SIGSQLVTQGIGVVATIAWCGIATFIILKLVDAMVGIRVTEEEETEGLDLVLHDERGYNL
ncbi:MAG: ammonium transporter, partial [Gammaproteobacteria bacterium]|nr:ammonium transporter [Gammaproteobacteria bacterium]